MFPSDFRRSQRYPTYSLGVLKNPFITRNTEKNAKITPKMKGKHGNTGEYEGRDYI